MATRKHGGAVSAMTATWEDHALFVREHALIMPLSLFALNELFPLKPLYGLWCCFAALLAQADFTYDVPVTTSPDELAHSLKVDARTIRRWLDCLNDESLIEYVGYDPQKSKRSRGVRTVVVKNPEIVRKARLARRPDPQRELLPNEDEASPAGQSGPTCASTSGRMRANGSASGNDESNATSTTTTGKDLRSQSDADVLAQVGPHSPETGTKVHYLPRTRERGSGAGLELGFRVDLEAVLRNRKVLHGDAADHFEIIQRLVNVFIEQVNDPECGVEALQKLAEALAYDKVSTSDVYQIFSQIARRRNQPSGNLPQIENIGGYVRKRAEELFRQRGIDWDRPDAINDNR